SLRRAHVDGAAHRGARVAGEEPHDLAARADADEVDALVAGAAQTYDERVEREGGDLHACAPVIVKDPQVLAGDVAAGVLEEADEAAIDVDAGEAGHNGEVREEAVGAGVGRRSDGGAPVEAGDGSPERATAGVGEARPEHAGNEHDGGAVRDPAGPAGEQDARE